MGIPMYHYSINAIKENRAAAIVSNDKKLSRHQKRKLERKLSKKIHKSEGLNGGIL
jgi:F0F1-type ATP synthase delta subunit